MKELACLGAYELGGGGSPPPVIVRTSYGRGWAVRLCWPLGPDLSTRRYRTTVIQCKPVCFGRSGAVFTVSTLPVIAKRQHSLQQGRFSTLPVIAKRNILFIKSDFPLCLRLQNDNFLCSKADFPICL
ncbi:hypothetical protein AVEN_255450-1 [Araneus ventricosus]|uniref:Uncharacterized protein n=1 Tax=Araneus ventricosus TaxID=182803 RepID=A0A4Y2JR04_ARAVE|nr:hypothetical protein AVEN_163622-1 [Araneus ventricosus]GBM93925.1 hypothetical protein AVEN_222341-1 [Araneus ventricosus]GBM94103.1 hypothetical protein AVEN_255450-1 [Araneus ventricosus]